MHDHYECNSSEKEEEWIGNQCRPLEAQRITILEKHPIETREEGEPPAIGRRRRYWTPDRRVVVVNRPHNPAAVNGCVLALEQPMVTTLVVLRDDEITNPRGI